MSYYMLTDQTGLDRYGVSWNTGKSLTVSGVGDKGSTNWLWYYNDPFLALILNQARTCVNNPRLWQCTIGGTTVDDRGIGGVCTQMTIIKEITVPTITLQQRALFGLNCVKQAYTESSWTTWANKWISGQDITYTSSNNICNTKDRTVNDWSIQNSYSAWKIAGAVSFLGYMLQYGYLPISRANYSIDLLTSQAINSINVTGFSIDFVASAMTQFGSLS